MIKDVAVNTGSVRYVIINKQAFDFFLSLIPRLLEDGHRASGVQKQVALENVDAFLQRFTISAERKTTASENVMDIVSASKVARWPVLDIVNGILGGLFENVELMDPSLNFKGVMIDPHEVRKTLARPRLKVELALMRGHGLSGCQNQGYRPACGLAWRRWRRLPESPPPMTLLPINQVVEHPAHFGVIRSKSPATNRLSSTLYIKQESKARIAIASGSHQDRPQLKATLENLRERDTFVIWKLSRFARSLAQVIKTATDDDDRDIALNILTKHIDTRHPRRPAVLSHDRCARRVPTETDRGKHPCWSQCLC